MELELVAREFSEVPQFKSGEIDREKHFR